MVSEVIGGACALELSLSRAVICPRLRLNSGFCNESWRTTHVVVLIPDLIFILSQRLGKIQVLDDIRNGLCLGFPWRVDTKFGLGRQSFERPQRDDRYTLGAGVISALSSRRPFPCTHTGNLQAAPVSYRWFGVKLNLNISLWKWRLMQY